MGNNLGGRRPGAGRKKKAPPTPKDYSAEDYLRAVVEGREPPHALRISAARTLIRFQTAVRRGPVPAPPAATLARKAELAADAASRHEFAEKAAAIRAKHGRR